MKKLIMTEPKLSWTRVAEVVSEKLGRRYTGAYCREVATGFRGSSILAPLLQELGVMPKPKQRSATKRTPTTALAA